MEHKISQYRSCIQKPLESEIHTIKHFNENSQSNQHNTQLRAAFFKSKVWPKNSTIKIAFIEKSKDIEFTPIASLQRDKDGNDVEIDPIELEIRTMTPEDAVKYVIVKKIQPLVGLTLEFVDNISESNVRIGFDPDDGSYSLVGTDCNAHENMGKKTLNYGWIDAKTIMHEIGHVLGMIHEHQNPNGQTISWNEDIVYKWANDTQGWDKETTFHNIIEKYKIDEINGSDFDPKSIMLYYYPKNFTTDGKGTSENDKLSDTDIMWIKKMYPGGTGIENTGLSKLVILFISLGIVLALLIIGFFIYTKYLTKKH
jgi:hypothetical protein